LPFPDDYASEILLGNVIEHVSYADGKKLISGIHRVLKKNGLFRISTSNLDYILSHDMSDPLMSEACVFGSDETKWQKHVALYTLDMLKRLLKQFETVEEEFVWHEIRLKAKK